jgi:hypothetical protein
LPYNNVDLLGLNSDGAEFFKPSPLEIPQEPEVPEVPTGGILVTTTITVTYTDA